MPDTRPYIAPDTIPCGGRSQKTGQRVGSRHRWNGGDICEFCGRSKDDVFKKDHKAVGAMLWRLVNNPGLYVYREHWTDATARYIGPKRKSLGRRACVSIKTVESAVADGLLECYSDETDRNHRCYRITSAGKRYIKNAA